MNSKHLHRKQEVWVYFLAKAITSFA